MLVRKHLPESTLLLLPGKWLWLSLSLFPKSAAAYDLHTSPSQRAAGGRADSPGLPLRQPGFPSRRRTAILTTAITQAPIPTLTSRSRQNSPRTGQLPGTAPGAAPDESPASPACVRGCSSTTSALMGKAGDWHGWVAPRLYKTQPVLLQNGTRAPARRDLLPKEPEKVPSLLPGRP